MNKGQDAFGYPLEHLEDYRVNVYTQPTPKPTACTVKVTHIPTGIMYGVHAIHEMECRRKAFAGCLRQVEKHAPRLNTIASIREVADEYPAEVGNSALLAEWVDREVR